MLLRVRLNRFWGIFRVAADRSSTSAGICIPVRLEDDDRDCYLPEDSPTGSLTGRVGTTVEIACLYTV